MISNAIIDLAKEVHRAVILPQSVKKPPAGQLPALG